MKKAVLMSLVAFTASVCADNQEIAGGCGSPPPRCAPPPPRCAPPPPRCAPPPPRCAPPPPVCKVPRNPCRIICDPCSLTPAAHLCDSGIYLFLEALYARTDMGNNDWLYDFVSGAASGADSLNYQMRLNWAWGFRFGIGYNGSYDDWDFGLVYTWFKNSRKETSPEKKGEYYPLHTYSSTAPTTAKYDNKMLFHILDLEMGRAHFLSRKLVARPHVGLKFVRFSNTVVTYFNPATPPATGADMTTNQKHTINLGMGPMLGFNTKWILGDLGDSYLSILGDFQGALLWAKHKNTRTQFIGTSTTPAQILGLDQRMVTPVTRMFMGLGWDSGLSNNTMHLGIRLGYEVQYWFRLNQFLHQPGQDAAPTTESLSYFRLSDDIAINGWTLGFRFDF